jgi:hypothetical protein
MRRKKTPEILAELERLMAPATAGDPITGLKWTRKTTAKVSQELKQRGFHACARTVARLLDRLDYALRVNHKKLSRGSVKTRRERNRQFRYVDRMRTAFADAGVPVISVDGKKKELIGCFKNPGAVWTRVATPVKDHDFRSEADALAVPYGIFDPVANLGYIVVGTSHDTPAFAADAIAHWWKKEGRRRYPHADKLLILADNGGSNGSVCRAWKHQLQTRLCEPFALEVTVCHYPPGASKWNPIEHRLFSYVSKNWAGEPLVSLETMLNFIRTTKTKTGLRVKASLNKSQYPTGIKPSSQEMKNLNLIAHQLLPKWNYTLAPRASIM